MIRRFLKRVLSRAPRPAARPFLEALFATDFDGVDEFGRSSLHYAALGGNVAHMKALLRRNPSLVIPDHQGWTPLHCAAHAQSGDCVRLLLEQGVPVDPQDSFGNTPLSKAVFESKGCGEVIGLLRAAGADPYRANNHGVSPLGLARMISNYPVAQFFNDLPE